MEIDKEWEVGNEADRDSNILQAQMYPQEYVLWNRSFGSIPAKTWSNCFSDSRHIENVALNLRQRRVKEICPSGNQRANWAGSPCVAKERKGRKYFLLDIRRVSYLFRKRSLEETDDNKYIFFLSSFRKVLVNALTELFLWGQHTYKFIEREQLFLEMLCSADSHLSSMGRGDCSDTERIYIKWHFGLKANEHRIRSSGRRASSGCLCHF